MGSGWRPPLSGSISAVADNAPAREFTARLPIPTGFVQDSVNTSGLLDGSQQRLHRRLPFANGQLVDRRHGFRPALLLRLGLLS